MLVDRPRGDLFGLVFVYAALERTVFDVLVLAFVLVTPRSWHVFGTSERFEKRTLRAGLWSAAAGGGQAVARRRVAIAGRRVAVARISHRQERHRVSDQLEILLLLAGRVQPARA